jgi:hypothetical protein
VSGRERGLATTGTRPDRGIEPRGLLLSCSPVWLLDSPLVD